MEVGEAGAVAGHGAEGFDLFDDFVKLLAVLGALGEVAEAGVDSHGFEVPGDGAAEGDDAAFVAMLFAEEFELADEDVHPFVEAFAGLVTAGLFPLGELGEDPGVGE